MGCLAPCALVFHQYDVTLGYEEGDVIFLAIHQDGVQGLNLDVLSADVCIRIEGMVEGGEVGAVVEEETKKGILVFSVCHFSAPFLVFSALVQDVA